MVALTFTPAPGPAPASDHSRPSLQLPPPVRFHRPQTLVGNPRWGRLQSDSACLDGQRPSAPQKSPKPDASGCLLTVSKGIHFPPTAAPYSRSAQASYSKN